MTLTGNAAIKWAVADDTEEGVLGNAKDEL
jgi:hypothetical protein